MFILVVELNLAKFGPKFVFLSFESSNARKISKLYVPVLTLSTQNNAKLLQQLKSGFKRTIHWSEYQSKPELLIWNPQLNHLIEPNFQGVNRLSLLSFENNAQKTSSKRYYFPNLEIKDCNVMINGKNVFDQPIKNDKITYEILEKLILAKEMIMQLVVY